MILDMLSTKSSFRFSALLSVFVFFSSACNDSSSSGSSSSPSDGDTDQACTFYDTIEQEYYCIDTPVSDFCDSQCDNNMHIEDCEYHPGYVCEDPLY